MLLRGVDAMGRVVVARLVKCLYDKPMNSDTADREFFSFSLS